MQILSIAEGRLIAMNCVDKDSASVAFIDYDIAACSQGRPWILLFAMQR